MPDQPTTEITETERGFHTYGEPLACTYGSVTRVQESSAASGPHVWVFIQGSPHISMERGVNVSAHLNEEQARGLIARLQAFVDEIPSRWDLSEEPDASS